MQLIYNRPNFLQHDDFHVGNIIMNNKRYAGVIDFNRYDWGDPIHEFYKLAWFSTEVSISFSVGQIRGYYDNRVPKYFWRLYSLYVAMSIFPTIVWFLSTQPNRVDYMKNRVNAILKDHKYFELLKPKWYNV
jgi:aminoglycoside phosphotransferase (APT) family kinase protein